MSFELYDSVAYLHESSTAITFSKNKQNAGATTPKKAGTSVVVRAIENRLKIAPWGEDNRFPQNVEQQMAFCGIGPAALDWKARALYGAGIIPGKIMGYEKGGKQEIFEPLDRTEHKHVYDFITSSNFLRFMLEYFQDWVWYANCFPEVILSNDCTQITDLVHQESCDSRYQQMDAEGNINYVFISKLWGAAHTQWVKFDPEQKLKGLTENPNDPNAVPDEFIKKLDCIDMYNAVNSLKRIAEQLQERPEGELRSAILPCNYPSVNKTYYQKAGWDAVRLAGWVELACKIPAMLKILYEKAFNIKYHIEIPDTYFVDKYGALEWEGMLAEQQAAAKKKLLKELTDFLSGAENAGKAFISFFKIDRHTNKPYGNVTITALEDKTNLDKELFTQSAADIQILIGMQVQPALFGAGTIGTGKQQSGGSDIREAFLVYNALLTLERQVALQPLYLVRDYNGWGSDIVFRIMDTVLTTLDKNTGTEKKVS